MNDDSQRPSNDPDVKQFASFLRTALMPLLVLKAFILYFGLNYSLYPDEGYGYGLSVTLVISLGSMAYFVWKQTRTGEARK